MVKHRVAHPGSEKGRHGTVDDRVATPRVNVKPRAKRQVPARLALPRTALSIAWQWEPSDESSELIEDIVKVCKAEATIDGTTLHLKLPTMTVELYPTDYIVVTTKGVLALSELEFNEAFRLAGIPDNAVRVYYEEELWKKK